MAFGKGLFEQSMNSWVSGLRRYDCSYFPIGILIMIMTIMSMAPCRSTSHHQRCHDGRDQGYNQVGFAKL